MSSHDDRSVPGPPGSASRVVSAEELAALLAGDAQTPDPLLLLATRADDVEPVSAACRSLGVPLVVAAERFQALDLFRARPYAGFVAAGELLPPELGWYEGRLREVDAAIAVWIVCDPGGPRPDSDVPVLPRPLHVPSLTELWGGLRRGASPAAPAAPDTGEGPPPKQERQEPAADPPERTADRGEDLPTALPLRALHSLLEARVAGRSGRQGLLAWAAREGALRGVAEVEERGGELRVRAHARQPDQRREMLLLLLQQLGDAGARSAEPFAAGSFTVFPAGREDAAELALWHRGAQEAAAFARELTAVLPLLDALEPKRAADPAGVSRDRFVELLASRMRGAERRNGRVAILLLETGPEDSPQRVCRTLRAVFRGGDWVEAVGRRVYVILDEPDRGVFQALGARLRDLPGIDRLRVVALGWNPLDGGAAELVGRAERILEGEGAGGEPLPGISR